MPRYIDADALIEAIKNELWDWQSLDDITATCVLKQTITDIQNAPTADVVEVVRCKDCDNWTDENGREGLCQVWSDFGISHLRYTPKDGYCSEGERRDDE